MLFACPSSVSRLPLICLAHLCSVSHLSVVCFSLVGVCLSPALRLHLVCLSSAARLALGSLVCSLCAPHASYIFLYIFRLSSVCCLSVVCLAAFCHCCCNPFSVYIRSIVNPSFVYRPSVVYLYLCIWHVSSVSHLSLACLSSVCRLPFVCLPSDCRL